MNKTTSLTEFNPVIETTKNSHVFDWKSKKRNLL